MPCIKDGNGIFSLTLFEHHLCAYQEFFPTATPRRSWGGNHPPSATRRTTRRKTVRPEPYDTVCFVAIAPTFSRGWLTLTWWCRVSCRRTVPITTITFYFGSRKIHSFGFESVHDNCQFRIFCYPDPCSLLSHRNRLECRSSFTVVNEWVQKPWSTDYYRLVTEWCIEMRVCFQAVCWPQKKKHGGYACTMYCVWLYYMYCRSGSPTTYDLQQKMNRQTKIRSRTIRFSWLQVMHHCMCSCKETSLRFSFVCENFYFDRFQGIFSFFEEKTSVIKKVIWQQLITDNAELDSSMIFWGAWLMTKVVMHDFLFTLSDSCNINVVWQPVMGQLLFFFN